MKKTTKFLVITTFCLFFLQSCGIYKPVDAKKFPPQPELRVKNNIEEGRGFRLTRGFGKNKSGNFEFANANPLWRASLDTISFMPLLSVDYGGGLIITDWYSGEGNKDSIKLTIQFLSNEIRADAIKINVFKKNCSSQLDCKITDSKSKINEELKVAILKKAAKFQATDINKNKKEYRSVTDLN
jgi:hypothetical protein